MDLSLHAGGVIVVPREAREAVEEDDRIFIDSIRDIEAGEELFYDYALEIDEPITEESKKKFACHCRSSECRGTMLDL